MADEYLKKFDRSVVTISDLKQDPLEETRYWMSKPPIERLIALELLRMRIAGYDNINPRIQRIFTITERP